MSQAAPPVVCPHSATCGACALLDVPYGEQLERKTALLALALGRHVHQRDAKLRPCVPSPLVEGYRNRAKMAIELPKRGGRALVGYYRFGTRTLVDAPDCRVLVPAVLETTRALRDVLSTPRLARVPLRFLDVRCGSVPTRQHVTLVLREADGDVPIAAVREACPHVTGISINVNPGEGSQVIKGRVEHAWGERHVIVDAGVPLHVSAGSFFQVNLPLLAVLHRMLRPHFRGCHRLADLYAGVGTHGLALHRSFERVMLVEGVTSASRDARTSIAAAGITNVQIVSASVERSLPRFLSEGSDAVVLNPSREGARPEVIHAIGRSRAKRVAYLSCEPETLARDLAQLVEAGFTISSVQAVDMMPQTQAVEALALLERAKERLPRSSET